MKRWVLGIIAGVCVAACAAGPVGNPNVPQPQKSVDLARYAGTWYELARYENRFEKDCEAVTAEYSLREDGLIGVLNRCHHDRVDGAMDAAEGKARVVEGSGNAKLRVSFFGPFFLGDYWVLDRADDYSWSIVGEPSGRYLWILVRSPRMASAQKQALYARARALGYDLRLLRETKHR